MIITGIETVPLRIPFKAGNRSDAFAWGDSNLPVADSLLVKVTTDRGLVGWGEAFGFRAVASAKLAVDQLIAPLCIGQDATRIEPLMQDVQKKLHVFGRAGALGFGVSAVDIALWDIAGKAAKLPLCGLLGAGAADIDCHPQVPGAATDRAIGLARPDQMGQRQDRCGRDPARDAADHAAALRDVPHRRAAR